MATLDDLKDILVSIDNSMTEQKDLLADMIRMQATRNRLSSVDTSVVAPSTGQSIGAAAAGIGSGVSNAATGLGLAGILGLGALAIFAEFDAEAIKENVITLLSISDEVGGKVELLKEGGAFFLAMSGIGIGLAALGIGQGLVGLGQWITDDEWTKTLKTNVIDLLSIADEVGGNLSFLYEGGTVGLALGGLGAGLAVFGVGQAAVGLAQFISADNWAQQVKDNVLTLLSIADEIPANVSVLDEAGTFFFAMSGLGAGLAIFGIGQAAVGLAQFISEGDWAQQVKDNVITLLSISEIPGIGWDTAGFVGVMGGIAAGLAVFALGKGANVIVEGASEALAYFTGNESFADRIKAEVATLLSIPNMDGVGADTVGFIATMAGITAGLAAFALGKGAATVVEGAADALAYFTGDEPFADKIKAEVETLLSIVGLAPTGSVDEFTNIMSKLGDGLSSFAGGNFVGTLKNAGAAIVSFFTGAQSPFEQIRLIASDADNLVKAADAIEKIAEALEKFGGINVDVGDINFEKLATNLGESIPLLYHLANGGIYNPLGPLNEIDFGPKGILDPSLKLDEMAAAIAKVNYVLGQTTEYPVGTVTPAAAPTGNQDAEKIAAASYAMVAGRPELPSAATDMPITITNATIDIANASVVTVTPTKANIDISESAAKAVAESPEITTKPYEQIMQEERDKANSWLSQAEAMMESNKEQNTNNVNYSPVTDASSKTYVGGTTNTTIITPRSGNDLNYGIPYGVQ